MGDPVPAKAPAGPPAKPPTGTPAVDCGWLGRMAPRVVIAGLVAGWALAVASGFGDEKAPAAWGGDYPAFHMAGKIALDGRLAELYDFDVQESYEQGMPRDGLLPFLYPPFVAAFYAPLAMLPYRAAYALFTLIAFASIAASLVLLRPLSATIRRDPWLAGALVLAFYPMFRAVLGGQNTALTLLILCGMWRLLHDGRDVAAGLLLGVLAYKPQLLVPVAGVVLLAGRFRVATGAAASAVVLFVASGFLAGWDWPQKWMQMLGDYAGPDRRFNLHASISLGQLTDLYGWERGWMVLSGLLSLWVAWVALAKGKRDLPAVLAIGMTASLLIAPHALYYDAGIALPAMMLVADRGRPGEAAFFWVACASQVAAAALPASPLIFVLLALLVVVFGTIGTIGTIGKAGTRSVRIIGE